VQRSLDAGALESLRLGYHERRIYYLHETIDRAIGVESIPETLRVPQIRPERCGLTCIPSSH